MLERRGEVDEKRMAVRSAFELVKRAVLAVARSWDNFWFQPAATTQLEIVRIGVGSALLFQYAMASPFLFFFWGDDGWMPRETAMTLITDPWMLSVFFYFKSPWQWIAFHTLFLCALTAFVFGWRTSLFKWIVLIGHISYDHRDLAISYGAQSIVTSLILVLCLAPAGRAISLDRVRAVRAAKRKDLNATLPPYTSRWANACTRLIQLQMVALFFFSGIFKVRGDDWWGGDAVWFAFTINEFYNPIVVWVFAHQYWLVTVATYAVMLIEIAYAFLIWRQRTRPYMLTAAIMLHLGFAFGLSLVYFAYVMICGHLSFLRQAWLERLGAWWKQKIGAMEMIYDGRCGFCMRSMAWFLAFDGLQQISVRDFRANPSPVVSDELLEKALYLVLPDGRTLPGFEAYRYVVLRVPGLWWMVPLFYTPLVSRLVGRPVYNWVASHRSSLSRIRWSGPRPDAAVAPEPIQERKAA
jgi:predicted DCC family thiol-disulfide oxidoreductase YuxK